MYISNPLSRIPSENPSLEHDWSQLVILNKSMVGLEFTMTSPVGLAPPIMKLILTLAESSGSH